MTLTKPRLVLFAKAAQAGAAKTRLAPALGMQGAADLARHMLDFALGQALATGLGPVELCMSPAPSDPAWRGMTLPAAVMCTSQGAGGLGQRMNRAVHRVTQASKEPVLLMGTDCPALTAARLVEAAGQLQSHDAVLVPATDGGYVLIGLNAPCPAVFSQMSWSTSRVSAETLRRMADLSMRVWRSPPLHDIDEPADLVHLPAGYPFSLFKKTTVSPICTGSGSSLFNRDCSIAY
ncbi:MAG: TIGR04282 family arsenosugar biosynthesis glycosyltransferase [Rhodoferax sp.]|nr:TIGR04282 family arsenosugar biosynthesis glycosyltransferase [Rhodoferax sp.]